MGKAVDDFEIVGHSVAALAPDTAATTAYEDVAGSAVVVAAATEDPTQVASYGMLEVNYSAILSKATGGDGTLGLYINGAILPDHETVVAFAQGAVRVTGHALVPRTSAAAQTVKLQAKSSDTNVLTISKPTISVKRLRMPGGVD